MQTMLISSLIFLQFNIANSPLLGQASSRIKRMPGEHGLDYVKRWKEDQQRRREIDLQKKGWYNQPPQGYVRPTPKHQAVTCNGGIRWDNYREKWVDC